MIALVKSIAEAESLIWAELMDILGYSADIVPPPVRRSWPVDGAPDWKITDDVVFMQLTEAEDEYMRTVDTVLESTGEDFQQSSAVTRVLSLSLNAYGPSCYENLLNVKMAVTPGRKNFKKNKIYLVPGVDAVRYAPELFQGRWWKRCDLTLKFNCLMVFETAVNAIKEVDITIGANNPGSKVINPGTIKVKG